MQITPVYDVSVLKNSVNVYVDINGVSTSVTSILHRPQNMNFIYPDSGLPDFVTQYVTLGGEIEAIMGMFVPFHDSQKIQESVNNIPFDTFAYPPILPSGGEWYFVENVPDSGPFVNGHIAVYNYPGYVPAFPRSYPVPVTMNLKNAYVHTDPSPSAQYFVLVPIWAWFTGKDSKDFPQFWSDADLLKSQFSENPEEGKSAVNIVKISKLGLIGVGSRVIVHTQKPYFYVAVPKPSNIGQYTYFEVYIGSSYKTYPPAGGPPYIYEDNLDYPDPDLESYEDVRVTVLSYTGNVSDNNEVKIFLGELDNNLNTTPLQPVYSLPSDTTLRFLMDYGFGPFSETSMLQDTFTAYYYMREWMIVRGIIFYSDSNLTNIVQGPVVFADLLRDEGSV